MIESVPGEAKRRATYQDVLDAPENVVAEVIDGELHTQPRPRMRHAIAASRLGAVLEVALDRGDRDPDGWVLVDEPELHLGAEPDIVVPDIAGWRRRRFIAEEPDPAFMVVAPDWLCEILSPSTAVKDRTLKLPLYAREGVRWVWLLDPQTRVLECYALDGENWRLLGTFAEEALVRAPPFEEVEISMGRLWEL